MDSCKEVKTGTNAKGLDWTLYECMDDKDKYSTFNDYSAFIGKPTFFEVESRKSEVINKKTGKPFENWTIKGMANKPTHIVQSEAPGAGTAILKRLDEIDKKVDDIIGLLTPEL